jgi:hypothetical protein
MKHEGHDQLAKWFDGYCEEIKRTTPTKVDGEVLRKLVAMVGSGEFEAGVKAMRKHPIMNGVSGFGLAIGAISTVVDPTSVLGILGLGASVFAVEAGFCQIVGLVPASYAGAQWPYLYAYGEAATQRWQKAVSKLLRDAR